MRQIKEGLDRWEDILKKKKKEIVGLKAKNAKRLEAAPGDSHA